MNTWLISDTHFYHTNIIKYCRHQFKNVDDMNHRIIKNWNATIDKDDIVYHLGDFALVGTNTYDCIYEEYITIVVNDLLSQLNGKIYFIFGNNDTYLKSAYEKNYNLAFEQCKEMYEKDDFILTHKPMLEVPYDKVNIHGHIHNNELLINEYKKKQWFNVSIEVLNYFPINLNNIRKRYRNFLWERKNAAKKKYERKIRSF